ncbi:hypothetical protein GpartN1_g5181.t1 [Galdieria partita]|uniref:PABS domain-containing protein n=1 Tax=Galdieria partita TaxID=83374 RepID=A0A9C7USD8_9RHOD|nr:hypothetical protein GpartN1_g5181.t1 [Galdieria partita]
MDSDSSNQQLHLNHHEQLNTNWFIERSVLWPGQAQSLQIEQVLFSEKSDFQDILVFKSKTYGTVLVLDGVIQVTERDEFAYQEMIVHLPMFSHHCPERVLVIGGGDGGVIREVLKHDCVREIVLCEIDSMVVDVCKTYLPQLAAGLEDPRVKIEYRDGAEYLRQHPQSFDVIITDSSDPVGPADVLFQRPFYESLYTALKPDGICCCQAESIWLHMDLIRPLLDTCRKIFATVSYAYTMIPTYPGGQIGFAICSKSVREDIRKPLRKPDATLLQTLKYYCPEIHQAAFVLPLFAKRELEDCS